VVALRAGVVPRHNVYLQQVHSASIQQSAPCIHPCIHHHIATILAAGWHCLLQDLASIQELLRPLEERGVLVKRSEEQLLRWSAGQGAGEG
jgi:hypothetical protein